MGIVSLNSVREDKLLTGNDWVFLKLHPIFVDPSVYSRVCTFSCPYSFSCYRSYSYSFSYSISCCSFYSCWYSAIAPALPLAQLHLQSPLLILLLHVLLILLEFDLQLLLLILPYHAPDPASARAPAISSATAPSSVLILHQLELLIFLLLQLHLQSQQLPTHAPDSAVLLLSLPSLLVRQLCFRYIFPFGISSRNFDFSCDMHL